MDDPLLKAPFPWFGGKSVAAPLIWPRLGNVPNLVIPFFGSGAELWGRHHPPQIETVNDIDAYVSNVWRAIDADKETVAYWCDAPVNEADLHAVHVWLVGQREEFTARLMGDPDYYDAKVAGRWLWGICCWIGGGWCSGEGPWQSLGGVLVDTRLDEAERGEGMGVKRKLVHLGDAGMGVPRQLVHLGNAGMGVQRRRVHLGNAGMGVNRKGARGETLLAWFDALQARLRYVRVCCGDWTRVLGPTVTWKHGVTGIILDPPYGKDEDRDMAIYAKDSGTVARDVRQWCVENGANPLLRIVLCGYGDIHDVLLGHGWTKVAWQAQGGYALRGDGRGRVNRDRERLWFSPHTLTPEVSQLSLF